MKPTAPSWTWNSRHKGKDWHYDHSLYFFHLVFYHYNCNQCEREQNMMESNAGPQKWALIRRPKTLLFTETSWVIIKNITREWPKINDRYEKYWKRSSHRVVAASCSDRATCSNDDPLSKVQDRATFSHESPPNNDQDKDHIPLQRLSQQSLATS